MSYASEARKTEGQKEAESQKKEDATKQRISEQQAISRAFSTADGKKALRAIMEKCCYQTQVTASTATGIDTQSMIHNGALQKHYLWLRQHIAPETLIEIEITGITST